MSESSDTSIAMVPPAPIAQGEPPAAFSRGRKENLASLRDKAANRSRSASPAKMQSMPTKAPSSGNSMHAPGDVIKPACASSMNSKEMPSLQDIIDRMSKKGIASSSSSKKISGTAGNSAKQAVTKNEESTFKEPLAKRSPSPVKTVTDTKENEAIKTADSTKSKASSTTATQSKEDKGHPLQHKWTMYFDSKSWNPSTNVAAAVTVPDTPVSPKMISTTVPAPPASTANSWEAALKMLGVYTSVESFMSIFSTLRRPSQLERNSNYHLFKNGIKPMWEDSANQNGGKWIITLKGTNSALLDRSWMWLVLALIGEELDENDDVTGAVVSTRSKGDRIALWIRNKSDVDLVNKIGKKFVMLLDLEREPGVSLEFSPNSMDNGISNRRPSQGTPSKFISFNNPPNFSSPNFGSSGTQLQTQPGPQQQSSHRLNSSPGKSNGSANHSRIGMTRRGSEQTHENGTGSPFPMGLGGPIGRTISPGPGKGGNGIAGGGGLLGKPKMGLGMSPPS